VTKLYLVANDSVLRPTTGGCLSRATVAELGSRLSWSGPNSWLQPESRVWPFFHKKKKSNPRGEVAQMKKKLVLIYL
jgi:hypothetical protein